MNDTRNTTIRRIAILLPILAGTCWGIAGIFIRILDGVGFDNLTIIFSRNIIGVPLSFLLILMTGKSQLRMKPRDLSWILGITLSGSIALMFAYNIAVMELSLSLAAILLCTAPVFVLLVSVPLFGEKINLKKAICMVMAFLGCAMLSGVFELGDGFQWSSLGIFMGLASAACNAVFLITSKVITDKGYSSFSVCFYSFLFTTIMLAPFIDWDVFLGYITDTPAQASIVLLTQCIVTSILPQVAYIVGLRYVEAGTTAILEGGAEPTAALLAGVIVYSEVPSLIGFAGVVVTVVALAVLAKAK